MADEEREIIRGNEAASLLGNSLLNEAFEAIDAHFMKKIKDSTLSQTELREEAFRMLCAQKEFRQHLTRFVTTGKMASETRAQRQDQEDRGRRLSEWDGSPDGYTGTGYTESP